MESERPNKKCRHSLTGQTDIYTYSSNTQPAELITPSSPPLSKSAELETEPTLGSRCSDDGSPTLATCKYQLPLPAFGDKETNHSMGIDQADHANTIIISDNEDDDSLFGRQSVVSMEGKNETQGELADHDVNDLNQPDLVIISDDEGDDNSLFGDLPSSEDDTGNAVLTPEPSLQGMDTPEAMSCVLMPHQRIGLKWLMDHELGKDKGGVLADDMGLGKTIQALALIFANPPKDPARKTTLIVAPLALLQQWPREIAEKTKPGHKLRVHVFHGKGRQISVKQLLSYDVVLTNYDSLTAEFKLSENKKTGMVLLHPDVRFHRIILDEAHNIKNRDTFAARGAFRLQADYRLAMTGTPLMNNAEELYSIVRFLDIPSYNEWEYFNRHIARPLQDASFDGTTLSFIAMRRINGLKDRLMLVRKKTDLLDGKPIISLPGRTDVVEDCTFDNDELAFYLSLQNQVQIEIQRFKKASMGQKKFTNLLVELLRLRQSCCHPDLLAAKKDKDNEQPGYLDDLDTETSAAIQESQGADGPGDARLGPIDFSGMTVEEIQAMLAKPKPKPKPKRKARTKAETLAYYRELEVDYQPSAKIRKTLEILASIQEKAPQDKIIIFSFFTSFLDILAIGIRRAGYKYKRYDGTLNATEKDEVVRDFTNSASSTKILLTSLKSGNAGLNLNIANHVIIEEPYWNPFVEQQAIDRAHRIGQKKPVSVHRLLVRNTVEGRIIELQKKKRAMVDIALGTGDNNELRQQREKFGALTKEDVFNLLKPSVELPDGVMKDDVRDNLRLFPSKKKAPGNSPTRILPANASDRPSGVMDRSIVGTPGRTQATARIGPRKTISKALPRGSTSIPASSQSATRPRVESNVPNTFSYKSPVENSAKSPDDGPTDWRKLLAKQREPKYPGSKRRRF